VYIEKADGRKRPLGIAALEDKIVQHAVGTILNQIYEEDFLGFSYGFRPGCSPHDALDALSYALLKKKVNYVLDADISSFFDTLDKGWLVKFVEHRVADPRILRLIQKWLKAGVMEDGKWSEAKTGSPQGSVISPLLANIYLHYAFDLWVNAWRKKWAQGEVVVIRFADDTIVGFQYQTDADRFLENLQERLGKFGMELHPDETRRIEFGRFAEQNRKRRGEGKPETFDFLGFTHISGKNGLGRFAVRRTTIRKRMRAKLRQVKHYFCLPVLHPQSREVHNRDCRLFPFKSIREPGRMWFRPGYCAVATHLCGLLPNRANCCPGSLLASSIWRFDFGNVRPTSWPAIHT
jgi:group II intron reverse transcriptase/maturase